MARQVLEGRVGKDLPLLLFQGGQGDLIRFDNPLISCPGFGAASRKDSIPLRKPNQEKYSKVGHGLLIVRNHSGVKHLALLADKLAQRSPIKHGQL
jgi:hypothetical protein